MQNSSNQINHVPPQSNELEVSLFGPGVGECVVIHIGDNEWIIIDSCLDSQTKNPIPLKYLDSIGVDPAQAVKLFVISHWHADHIRGAALIAERCSAATVCFSEALIKEEFCTLVDVYSGFENSILVDRETCATKEMAAILKMLKTKCNRGQTSPTPYTLVSADKRIYHRVIGTISDEIWALSPSSESIVESLKEIANLIPTTDKENLREVIPKTTQNNNAVVMFLKFRDSCNVLLGSDLEETKSEYTGWSFIIGSANRPNEKSTIFKIPHHGSHTGHSDDVWRKMVEKDAIAILTSKLGGRSDIPKERDIQRIKKHTENVYCTSVPLATRQKRERTVEKTMNSVVKRRVPLNGAIGHIQIRIDPDSNIHVGLQNPAKKL